GRTVDFRNTVVIMTSNLGSDLIQERFGELDYAHMKELVLGVVSHNFRPEFINRIDEVVVFHPLGEQHIASIAQIQLKRLYKRLEERGYEIHISDEADRKSTRLNSSHVSISYAVFCLKKKK